MQSNSILNAAVAALALAGFAQAQGTVLVSSDITTSTTWTANNVYNLQQQIFVRPGATLTIEAGTVIASTTNLGGSLAVCRGAQIFAVGTDSKPIIFTSQADVATWVGGNPKTGTAREAANEWGNLTIMGAGYVAENAIIGNTPAPSASNYAIMEGLTPFTASGLANYGGGNDDDDSGSVRYCSIRYAGKVVGLNNELNGLSLGGIGRGTDIDHVEIYNNVDDGIEIWGGTVSLKYFSIWNVGDDSFDIDQGWRGKAQFGLIVQGHSVDAAQGSGVGDNAIEIDGAEDSDWQPVTTTTMYNMTVIGQPNANGGDHLVAYRDNARLQLRNSILMDAGEQVVRLDNVDGDGANGYGFNGTLSWAATWTTPYTATSTVNAPANPAAFYTVQTSGNLNEIKDTVFYNNNLAAAYNEAVARGVFTASNNNVLATSSPIQNLARGPQVTRGGKIMLPVTNLDPRPANDALTAVGFASGDSFFTAARYRGAFAPGCNWLSGWTATEAFGITPTEGFRDLGLGKESPAGYPVLAGVGNFQGGSAITLSVSNAPAFTFAILALGTSRVDFPVLGGTLIPDTLGGTFFALTDAQGASSWNFGVPAGFPAGFDFYWQAAIADAGASFQTGLTNGQAVTSR